MYLNFNYFSHRKGSQLFRNVQVFLKNSKNSGTSSMNEMLIFASCHACHSVRFQWKQGASKGQTGGI